MHPHDAHRRAFIKLNESVCRAEGWSQYEGFRAFLEAGYRAIRGAFLRGDEWQANEDEYMKIVARCRHKQETMKSLAEMLNHTVDGMDGPCTPASAWHNGGRCRPVSRRLPMQISVIGLDIAKQVFQVHAADAAGRTVAQIKLRRAQVLDYFQALPPCFVGLEACATAHYWARELSAVGHTVRLMPPAYVKPYVKRNKTDAADAQAIAEALTRPTMRFVPVKSADQQAMLMLHRVRELLVRQRTMLATALRAHLAEFGIIAPQGIQRVEKLAAQLHDPSVPPLARDALNLLVEQLASTWKQIDTIEMQLIAIHRTQAVSRRLASIPGIGPITAMAIASTVSDPTMFRSGREFAAWLGLTPKSHSSGGKDRLGRISKRGDRYIRHLLYVGAGNVIRFAKARAAAGENWIRGLQQRRPPKVVIIALANKMARIAWALMVREQPFRSPAQSTL